MIPSLGPLAVLSVIYILLTGWSPMELMVFYMALLVVSQYMDAIPAVYLGVPGETGAIPTAYESQNINDIGLKNYIIRNSAIGRTIGCVVAGIATLFIIDYAQSISTLFSARVQLGLFALAMVGIAVTSNNRWFNNVLLMTVGYCLGMVGYNFYLDRELLTAGWAPLYGGLPLIPVIMGIYVFPMLITHIREGSPIAPVGYTNHTLSDPTHSEPFPIATVARSSIMGYFLGLIPGVSYILSGTGSYSFEKWFRSLKEKYRPGDPYTAVACETGNSAGAFSSLLPLLYFGIPITASESLVFDMMLNNGAIFQQGSFLLQNIWTIVFCFLLILVTALILSWPMAKICLDLFLKINVKLLYVLVMIFCLCSMVMTGWLENTMELNFVVFGVCLLLGLVLKRHDVLPLLFVLIMQNSIEASANELFQMIF